MPELVYVADPMCSWCWGFSGVVEALRALAPTTVLLGGLRPGTTRPLDARTKATIRDHWTHVHEATGQPFDMTFFDRDGFVYDTEPSCRAVVAGRLMSPGCEVDPLAAVQRAFYAEGRDVTDPMVLAEVVEGFCLDRDEFEGRFDDDATKQATASDFETSRELGITAYPALLGRHEGKGRLITLGYHAPEVAEKLVRRWLDRL